MGEGSKKALALIDNHDKRFDAFEDKVKALEKSLDTILKTTLPQIRKQIAQIETTVKSKK